MAGARSGGAKVERLLAQGRWSEARKAIRTLLSGSPDSHWLLSRLALTHYEQRDYERALALDLRAVALAPRCPLALWGLAGSLEMVGREGDAARIYQRLIRRGAAALAHGTCGEGARWASGLVADCWFRLGQLRQRDGKARLARSAYQKHLALRGSGRSIYAIADVRRRLGELSA